MQCICGVATVYCVSVSVHVFVHEMKKQPRKRVNEDNMSTVKKMIGVPINGFKPTHSCLLINYTKPCATGYVLIGGNRVTNFHFSAYLNHSTYLFGTIRSSGMFSRNHNLYRSAGIYMQLFCLLIQPKKFN